MAGNKKLALKYGRISGNRPLGHGGSRGNGQHLSSNASETSENAKRNESRVKRAIKSDRAKSSF